MKENIIQRLYDNKHITFEEMLILLGYYSSTTPPGQPYYPILTPNCSTTSSDNVDFTITTSLDNNSYSDSFKTYDPKEYKESK